jgi:tRNA-dihydrouridine synthase
MGTTHRLPGTIGEMKGRVNGMYNWRLGWRLSVLNERNGIDITLPQCEETEELFINFSSQLIDQENSWNRNAWIWWNEICGNPKYILAPMIGQSEMAFRVLCREVGDVHLCYSPMYLAKNVLDGQHDDEIIHSTSAPFHDRPLICQLAGNNIEEMVAAGRHIQSSVDAIDVNLGCPQRCADIGNYGSYLPERDLPFVISMVSELVTSLSIPVTVKIRLLPGDLSHTINYALQLQATGISAICIHGRNRHQKDYQGPADWSVIKLLKSILKIPVIANGSLVNYQDVQTCLQYTQADAVMSGTGLLRNPSLFKSPETYLSQPFSSSPSLSMTSLTLLATDPDYILHLLLTCQRYLQLTSILMNYPGTISVNTKDEVTVIRDHFFAMLQVILMDTANHDLWSLLSSQSIQSTQQFQAILDVIYHRCLPPEVMGSEERCDATRPGDGIGSRKRCRRAEYANERDVRLYSLRDIKKSNWK